MSWVLAFVGFALLVVLHEAGHFFAAKAVGMRVERFALFFPPLVWRRKRGETEYALGTIPAGGYVKITGMNPNEPVPPQVAHRAYFRQPVWKRIVVIAAGPLVNVVLAFLILWALFWAIGMKETTRTIAVVDRGLPAHNILQAGDQLVAVDGRRGSLETLSRQIGSHRCAGEPRDGCRAQTPARVTVLREGRERTFSITPVYDAEARRTRVGFVFDARDVAVGPGRAADMSVDKMWQLTSATVSMVGRLFYDERARDEVGSAVGAYERTRQTFNSDVAEAIGLLGLISLSLAIINLFPFLPLDGGHIFWALAEKVRGRAIPFRVMERASVVGFMLVLILFFMGFTNDIERISDGTLGPPDR